GFVEAARKRPAGASVLAVTPCVADEKPVWVNVDGAGRITDLGGSSGMQVTAGMYMLSERARAARPPALGRLREFLRWLLEHGETMYAETIETVVDVDCASDIALAEALAVAGPGRTSGRRQVSGPHCLGILRERVHSPGREYDDSEILTLTGKELEARGFQVTLKRPEDALGATEPRPLGVFMMCERIPILKRLHAVEARGVPHVNSPRAVLNTYPDRMITQFQEAHVPFVPSRFVATSEELAH